MLLLYSRLRSALELRSLRPALAIAESVAIMTERMTGSTHHDAIRDLLQRTSKVLLKEFTVGTAPPEKILAAF